jgi:RNA-directed DNA polymerase
VQLGRDLPTVTDRIAQMVVKMTLEPELEPFWRYDWVVDLDIKGFFDNLRHDLLLKALQKHTTNQWVLLYIKRWLIAPLQQKDGTLIGRDKGTPQGSVISPLLANLYLHYAMDEWLRRNYPKNPFERYADDSVVHCKTEREAKDVLVSLKNRMAECGLELHPDKTKIVYCKDDDRRGDYPITKFDIHFVEEDQRIVGESTLSILVRQSVIQRRNQCVRKCAVGKYTYGVINHWKIFPICSTQSCEAGIITMENIINLNYTAYLDISIGHYQDGQCGSTKGYEVTNVMLNTG